MKVLYYVYKICLQYVCIILPLSDPALAPGYYTLLCLIIDDVNHLYVLFCSYYANDGVICKIKCNGDEDRLEFCQFYYCSSCAYDGGAAGITCSKQCNDQACSQEDVLAWKHPFQIKGCKKVDYIA